MYGIRIFFGGARGVNSIFPLRGQQGMGMFERSVVKAVKVPKCNSFELSLALSSLFHNYKRGQNRFIFEFFPQKLKLIPIRFHFSHFCPKPLCVLSQKGRLLFTTNFLFWSKTRHLSQNIKTIFDLSCCDINSRNDRL